MSQDSQLQQDVLAEFNWEPSVTAGHIGVTANHGVITLSGHVSSYAQKHAAETAARRVKAVADEIEVRLSFDTKRSDEDIAAAVISRLAWNVSVPKDAIKVGVEKGWVTLTGEVDWWYQRDAIEQDIRPLLGVTGVSNQTTIKPQINTAHLRTEIEHALNRSWFSSPDDVHVRAEGGKIILTGTVQSPYDRQIAAQTAWSAPGATNVENDIAVL